MAATITPIQYENGLTDSQRTDTPCTWSKRYQWVSPAQGLASSHFANASWFATATEEKLENWDGDRLAPRSMRVRYFPFAYWCRASDTKTDRRFPEAQRSYRSNKARTGDENAANRHTYTYIHTCTDTYIHIHTQLHRQSTKQKFQSITKENYSTLQTFKVYNVCGKQRKYLVVRKVVKQVTQHIKWHSGRTRAELY